ncbi:MAG TPA: galactokinase [Candidatus Nitrosotenuis sp.]|jgi:D-glycero-alpha-D-manno-heptose-7-phosphate kinase|nr:galactokinase [Candidatus Nitrosotenuis sp.]
MTRTPFRITLGGGGTDLPSYYRKHGGFVLAMGIDKYMYLMLHPPTLDSMVRLQYSRSEVVFHASELKHELAREALLRMGVENKIEVSSLADLPAGSGLGSSGAYLVGLLMALTHYKRDYIPLQELAEIACSIEMETLGRCVGKQDQYMACFGGLTALEIDRQGKVEVRVLSKGSSSIAEFVANTHMYYTGFRRDALEVLQPQDEAMRDPADPRHVTVEESLHRIKELGYRIQEAIIQDDYDTWGRLLDEHWRYKKQLSPRVSLGVVDQIYEEVRQNYNVLGGKISGAGGGGFLMLYCTKNHRRLEEFMRRQHMPRLHYTMEPRGTRVLTDLGPSFKDALEVLPHPEVPVAGR